jgi:NAD(P)-dependent dehydrogenase (short-subunit alcohol dehydrogenase family)
MRRLAGRAAVITGAAHGIGEASAAALAKQGVRLLLADIDEAAVAAVAAAITGSGGEAVSHGCDVGQDAAFDSLRSLALERFGQVDILMNNVGVLVSGLPQDIPLAEWQRVINVNLMSVVRGVQAFMPDMIARGEGHIVNTASFAGLFPYAFDRLPYAMTKGAIITLSEGLALYLKPQGVGVTCLCPGPVKTEIGKTMKSWTAGLALRGPGADFEMLDSEAVGQMVVEAIQADRFFLPTHPHVRERLMERAGDFDAFLDKQIAGIAASAAPRP